MNIIICILVAILCSKLALLLPSLLLFPVVVAVLVLLAVIIDRNPYIGIVIFYLISSFFGSKPIFETSIVNVAAYQVVIIIMLLVFINKSIFEKYRNRIYIPKILLSVIILFCVSIFLVGLLNNRISHFKAIKNGATFSSFFLLFLLSIKLIRSKDDLKKAFFWLISITVGLNILSLIEYLYNSFNFGSMMLLRNGAYFTVAKYGPNHLCSYIFLIIPFVIVLLFTDYPKEKKYIKLSMLILLLSLMLTFSRAGFLGFILIIFVLSIYNFKQLRKLFTILVVAVAIGSMLYLFRPGAVVNRMTEDTLVSRKILTNVAIAMIKDNLFIGVGPDRFKEEKYNYISSRNKYIGTQYSAHNGFLDLAAEQGIIVSGLLVISILIFEVYSFNSASKIISNDGKLLCLAFPVGLMGFLVTNIFSSTFTGNMIQLVPLMMGLSICLVSYELGARDL